MSKETFFKTPKGTILPLMDLKGKDYLQVAHRIIWFREDHPDWIMEVSFPILEKDIVLAKATITDEKGQIRAIAHRTEFSMNDLENAETGAIGRALGHLGYGTQFCTELLENEGKKLADSPIQPGQSEASVRRKAVEPPAMPKVDAKPVATVATKPVEAKPEGSKQAQFNKINNVYSLCKQAKWTEKDLKLALDKGLKGKTSVNQLSEKEYDNLVQVIKSGWSVDLAIKSLVTL
jgi:hypothetical protein